MERHFEVGDFVLNKFTTLQTKSTQECHAIIARFYGPYQVLERIGEVVYKLHLLVEVNINDVFYVSQLKKYHGELYIHQVFWYCSCLLGGSNTITAR